MKKENVPHNASTRNGGFTAFLCLALGCLLLEVFVLELKGGLAACVAVALIGVPAPVLIWRRATPYWTLAADRVAEGPRQQGSGRLRAADLISVFLLAGVGYLGAGALLIGWATSIAAFALGLYLLPWSRIPLFRSGMFVPCALIVLGAAAHLYAAPGMPHPIKILVAVWMLWLTAGCGWIRDVFGRQKNGKVSEPTSPRDAAEHPDTVPHR